MKKLLTLATIALVALAMGVSAQASPQSEAALTRKITWQAHRIHNLEQRRNYLHRYIRDMRSRLQHHATSTTSYRSGALSASQVAAYARAAGFPESAIPTMVAYAYRESHFEPGAINSTSGACGLWQIYPAQPGCTNPATNAALAYQKYRASGFSPWGG